MKTHQEVLEILADKEDQDMKFFYREGIPFEAVSHIVKSPYLRTIGKTKILADYKYLRQKNIPEISAAIIASRLRTSKLSGKQGLDRIMQAFLIAYEDYPEEPAADIAVKDAKDSQQKL